MTLPAHRDPAGLYLMWFLIVLAICLVGPYLLRVRPTTRRHWTLITLTIAFAVWLLLPQMNPLR